MPLLCRREDIVLVDGGHAVQAAAEIRLRPLRRYQHLPLPPPSVTGESAIASEEDHVGASHLARREPLYASHVRPFAPLAAPPHKLALKSRHDGVRQLQLVEREGQL